MSDWDAKMDALKSRFVERTGRDGTLLAQSGIADLDLAQTISHRISGSAGMFGFSELGKCAEALEDAVRSGCGSADLEKKIARLIEEIGRLQAL